MLDLELVQGPTQTGLDIVPLAEMKGHLRISNSALDAQIAAAVEEAADKLHGLEGELNRTVFPCTWVRYLPAFPSSGKIRLPYPPLIEVTSIAYEDGEGASPLPTVSASDYIVQTIKQVPQVTFLPDFTPPTTVAHPRAVAVTYRAGYETYPEKLKRLVKILAAHYFENPEATINDPKMTLVNRPVEFAVDSLRSALRVTPAYDDWSD